MKKTVYQSVNSPYLCFIKENSEYFHQASLLLSEDKHLISWALFSFLQGINPFQCWQNKSGTEDFLSKWKSIVFYGEENDADLSISLTAWLDLKDRFDINSQNTLINFIKGLEASSGTIRFPTFRELEFFLKLLGGSIALISANVIYNDEIQAGDSEFLEPLSSLGAGILWWQLLKKTSLLANEGKLFIPLDDLALFNCTEEDLLLNTKSESIKSLTKFELQKVNESLIFVKKNLSIYPKGIKDSVKFLCNKYEDEIHSALRLNWLLSSPDPPVHKTSKSSWFINNVLNLNSNLLKK
ncbi:MAG: squalene/phytoene synthase family protein [Candidatus Caenarcaniphilales bacterium]|nr:squalene/phytoene synthase family protein [Candidatus Caenarcaniphilales bacterium]